MSDYVSEPLPANEVVESDEEVVANANEAEEPATEEPAEEPATEEPSEEPLPAEEPVSTQEVVQNVQEMLTTEPAVSSDSARLEERVKVLEEKLEKLKCIFSCHCPRKEIKGIIYPGTCRNKIHALNSNQSIRIKTNNRNVFRNILEIYLKIENALYVISSVIYF